MTKLKCVLLSTVLYELLYRALWKTSSDNTRYDILIFIDKHFARVFTFNVM